MNFIDFCCGAWYFRRKENSVNLNSSVRIKENFVGFSNSVRIKRTSSLIFSS